MTRADTDVLARAVGYPYLIPRRSFTFDADEGTVDPYPPDETGTHRTAVLAVGSNASPEQLRRKFPATGRWGRVPVVLAELHEHDVVYAARISSYGAIPATLTSSPGTSVELHVTLLDDSQLDRLDETESVPTAYERLPVPAHLVRCVALDSAAEVYSYAATSGPLVVDGSPIALTAATAAHRRFVEKTEAEVLDLVAEHLRFPGRDELILTAARDPQVRRELNRRLTSRLG